MGGIFCRGVAMRFGGSETAGRKWVKYEIKKGWDDDKGVVGIYIHKLKNLDGKQATKGASPFDDFTIGGKSMASIVKAHNPAGATSKEAYATVKDNIADWVEEAIEIRGKNRSCGADERLSGFEEVRRPLLAGAKAGRRCSRPAFRLPKPHNRKRPGGEPRRVLGLLQGGETADPPHGKAQSGSQSQITSG
jgi:hypothetical protein